MSAAKMVADSTQADVPEMSGTKKRKKTVQKKLKKKIDKKSHKKTKKKSPEREFDDADLDLDKEMYPIGRYVKDREALLEQLFHCVKGPSLDRTLPDVLQDLPVDNLKQRCLEQLLVMSKKRIRRILAGDDPATISSSGTEDETSEDEAQVMEQDEDDIQVDEEGHVDSTSLYEQSSEHSQSDRYVFIADDNGDDSTIHSSMSPYPSDEENTYTGQYGDDSEQEYQNEYHVPLNNYPEIIEFPNESNSQLSDTRQAVVVREPEDPEEGEVFSDDNEPTDGPDNEPVSEPTNDASNDATTQAETTKVVEISADNGDTNTETQEESNGEKVEKCTDNDGSGSKSDVEVNCDKPSVKNVGVDSESVGNNEKEESGKMEASETRTEREVIKETSDEKNEDVVNKTKSSDEGTGTTDSNDGQDKVSVEDESGDTADDDNGSVLSIEDDDDEQFSEEAEGKLEVTKSDQDLPEGKKEDKSEKPKVRISAGLSREVVAPRRVVKPPSKDTNPSLTKNEMELLELEMRARAIKAMLKTAK